MKNTKIDMSSSTLKVFLVWLGNKIYIINHKIPISVSWGAKLHVRNDKEYDRSEAGAFNDSL